MDKIIYFGIVIGLFTFLFSTEIKYANINSNLKKLGNFLLENTMLFLIIIGMCANNNRGDALAYKVYFSYLVEYGKNPWDVTYEFFTQCVLLIMRLLNDFSYGKIRALILLTCWLTIVITYRRYIINFCLISFFYIASFMFAHDGAQIKNFSAVTLVLVACSFLIEKREKYLLKYYIVLFVAILMHFSCFVYLCLPLIHAKNFKKYIELLPFVGGGMYLIMYVLGTKLLSNILEIVANLFPLITKVTRYLYLYSGKRSLVYVSVYFVIYIAMRLLCNSKCLVLNKYDNYQLQKFNYMITNVWKLMGVFLPLLLYANAVFRLYRNLIILVFIFIANGIIRCRRFSHSRMKNSVYAMAIVIALLFQPIVLGQAIDVFRPVFEGDFFWNY